MINIKSKLLTSILIIGGVLALVIYALLPAPVVVEVARVTVGAMMVSIDEEGQTRVCDPFTISAPIAGRLARINLKEGDQVSAHTLIASIDPLPLDAREREELLARVGAAQATHREANAQAARLQTELSQAERESTRAAALAAAGLISLQQLEQAKTLA
jgi:HlyD family secretion protein